MADKKFRERVIDAQLELKAPKSQYNSYGKYSYRNAEDILEAVKPINAKHGLLLTLDDHIEQVGSRYYIKALATLSDIASDESLQVTAYAREPESRKGMDDAQVSGATSSYARKYALNGLYLIDDTKDSDTDEYSRLRLQKARAQSQQAEQAVADTPQPLICEQCAGLIEDTVNSKGETISADAIARASQKKYGLALCWDCMAERAGGA